MMAALALQHDLPSEDRGEEAQPLGQRYRQFRELLNAAGDFALRGDRQCAAVYAEMAALSAVSLHCGMFASPELERVLLSIAPRFPSTGVPRCRRTGGPRRILHVATSVMSIGGLTRMLWRWIDQDSGRCHSVALTHQPRNTVPDPLAEAIAGSGGRLHLLNQRMGTIEARAKRLRAIASGADLVVLHIGNRDVVPLLAFADKADCPPVLYLDHADHLFWLGRSISDLVVCLRESGLALARNRRGISPDRLTLLPIILEPMHRALPRAEAKQKLGIDESAVMLLSVARAVKYRTMNGVSYADAHLPLLRRYPQAILVIVGPGDRPDWADAIRRAEGRLIVLPERGDTSLFYQAADIYLDSYPFVSNTSLLEAGSFGVPLISLFPYSDGSAVLGADMPGLTGNLVRARSMSAYIEDLSRLIEDADYRLALGTATQCKIEATHRGDDWQQELEGVYERAYALPPVCPPPEGVRDRMCTAELDLLMADVHGVDCDPDLLLRSQLRYLPPDRRVREWLSLSCRGGFADQGVLRALRYLVPEWIIARHR